MQNLTIVTTSNERYARYLTPWAQSLLGLETRPGAVVIVTHGSPQPPQHALDVYALLKNAGFNDVTHWHTPDVLDFGTARNQAVSLSATEWVMHLDVDDRIMPHALIDAAAIAPDADVISFGYERAGDTKDRPTNRTRLYKSDDGERILEHAAPCSGVSPFRRSFWERSPYRTDMLGAWDTALWIGFARLGARFRATKRPVFWYWHHTDSVFTKRRLNVDWTHAITVAQLGSLRRNDSGVAFIVPRDDISSAERTRVWESVRAFWENHFPEWAICEGYSTNHDWCKGDAIAHALRVCTADILVIADADCLVEPSALQASVDAVRAGAPWAVPHDLVYRATHDWTERYLAGDHALAFPSEDSQERQPYTGYAGGGIFVVRRVHYEAVGGIPRSFRGWGSEDAAIALILNTLIGPVVRGKADLLHLWHPPQKTRRQSLVVATNMGRFRRLEHASRNGKNALFAELQSLPHTRLKRPAVFPSARPNALLASARRRRG